MARPIGALLAYVVLALCFLDSVATAAVPGMPGVLVSIFGQVAQPSPPIVQPSLPEFPTSQPDESGAQRAAPLPPGTLPPADVQPTSPQPVRPPQQSLTALLASNQSSYRNDRLYSTPNMFGDSFFSLGQILGETPSTHGGLVDIPGSRRTKIAENSSPLPQDRVYFMYQHFHNAIRGEDYTYGAANSIPVDASVNRYVLGMERTFLSGCLSVDIRIPLQDPLEYGVSPWPTDYLFTSRTDSGSIGNISIAVKGLLYESCCSAISAGLVIDLPTGPSVYGDLYFQPYKLQNESVHLAPFVGAVYRPDDNWFFQSFVQADVDANGSPVQVQLLDGWLIPVASAPIEIGVLQSQTVMYMDMSVGRWLLRGPDSRLLAGIAGLVELHYTTTLQDADLVTLDYDRFSPLEVGNRYNRVDVMNLSAGFHVQFRNGLDMRVAAVSPLRSSESDRSFDFEFGAQVNWRF